MLEKIEFEKLEPGDIFFLEDDEKEYVQYWVCPTMIIGSDILNCFNKENEYEFIFPSTMVLVSEKTKEIRLT